jgi:hypothetical protein
VVSRAAEQELVGHPGSPPRARLRRLLCGAWLAPHGDVGAPVPRQTLCRRGVRSGSTRRCAWPGSRATRGRCRAAPDDLGVRRVRAVGIGVHDDDVEMARSRAGPARRRRRLRAAPWAWWGRRHVGAGSPDRRREGVTPEAEPVAAKLLAARTSRSGTIGLMVDMPTTRPRPDAVLEVQARRSDAKRVAKLARADPIESRVGFEAGPAANNPGPRAVLRRHAPSATRQRTLAANGIDCGAGPVYERTSYAASSTARAQLSRQESLARIVKPACGRRDPVHGPGAVTAPTCS